MKVLFDGRQGTNRSGTGRYAHELARHLRGLDSGPDLRLVWPRTAGAEVDWIAGDQIEFCGMGPPPMGTIQRNVLIRRLVRDFDPDVVHYPANIGNLVRFPSGARARTVLSLHDVTFLRNRAWFRPERALYYRLAAGRSVSLADRIITDSSSAADDIGTYFGVASNRIDVIPLGVSERYAPADDDAVQAARTRYGLPDRFFLFVGTLEPRKNLERIIAAWSSVAETGAADLVIAGRSGWKVGPMLKAVARSPHRDRIHLIGYVDDADLPAVLSCALAFVWPSLWEGFGLPPLEAMACGTPVLSSNRSSLPEVLGEDALLVDPEDVNAIAAGMLRLARDEKLHEALRLQGLARAKGYAWERTASLTYESYRRAAER